MMDSFVLAHNHMPSTSMRSMIDVVMDRPFPFVDVLLAVAVDTMVDDAVAAVVDP